MLVSTIYTNGNKVVSQDCDNINTFHNRDSATLFFVNAKYNKGFQNVRIDSVK